MGNYATKAKSHLDRIQHFYDHGGDSGHAQAMYHYTQLPKLRQRATRSLNDRADAMVIKAYEETARALMEAMEGRQGDS